MSPVYRALLRAASGVDVGGGGGGPVLADYNAAVAADSPVGYWKLDETSGTTATDSSGNANHGTYSGTPSLGSRTLGGDFDSVSDFDGTNDHVSIPALGSTGWSAYTLEAWVTADALTAGRTVLTEQYTGSGDRIIGELGLDINSAASTDLEFGRYSGASWNVSSPGYAMSTSSLYHLVGVNTGSTGILYVNGVPVAQTAIAVSSDNEGWYIGRRHDASGSPYWDGAIGYVAIYDSALSHTRILAHYEAATAVAFDYELEVLADSPKGYWKLDESSGTRAHDFSGNGKHGTYVNSPSLASRTLNSILGAVSDFDGTNDHVSITGLGAGSYSDITVEAWVSADALNAGSGIVSEQYTGVGDKVAGALGLDPSGAAATTLDFARYSGSSWAVTTPSYTVSTGTLYHVVGAIDGTGTTGRLYVNGSQVATVTMSYTPDDDAWYIGRRHDTGGSPYWDGIIGHVAIYDSELSSTRIAAHYAAGT